MYLLKNLADILHINKIRTVHKALVEFIIIHPKHFKNMINKNLF